MALIRRHHSNDDKTLATREADPFRWMREMLRWDPFQTQTMPQWFGPAWEPTFAPAFEVKETKDSFQYIADLPGIKNSDIDVKITGDRLVVSGKREAEKEEKEDTYYTYERSFGSFQRAFMLPDGLDTDHVHAEMKDGVLTVALPKKASVQTKTIAVKTDDKAKS
jgi:HSP20 family protein